MNRGNTSDKKIQINQEDLQNFEKIAQPKFEESDKNLIEKQIENHYKAEKLASNKPTRVYKDKNIDLLLEQSEKIFQNIAAFWKARFW